MTWPSWSEQALPPSQHRAAASLFAYTVPEYLLCALFARAHLCQAV